MRTTEYMILIIKLGKKVCVCVCVCVCVLSEGFLSLSQVIDCQEVATTSFIQCQLCKFCWERGTHLCGIIYSCLIVLISLFKSLTCGPQDVSHNCFYLGLPVVHMYIVWLQDCALNIYRNSLGLPAQTQSDTILPALENLLPSNLPLTGCSRKPYKANTMEIRKPLYAP